MSKLMERARKVGHGITHGHVPSLAEIGSGVASGTTSVVSKLRRRDRTEKAWTRFCELEQQLDEVDNIDQAVEVGKEIVSVGRTLCKDTEWIGEHPVEMIHLMEVLTGILNELMTDARTIVESEPLVGFVDLGSLLGDPNDFLRRVLGGSLFTGDNETDGAETAEPVTTDEVTSAE
jgi:hypothetical protein